MLRTNVKDSELVDLDRVFRFTKQIAAVIEAVVFEVGAFSHLDNGMSAVSTDKDEPASKPAVTEYESDVELYNKVFALASKAASRKSRRGQVAVICFDPKKYEKYAIAGSYKKSLLAIESRSDLNQIRYSGKRFVYSEPEQVAGHQFEDVFVINVDSSIFNKSESPLERREAISRLYLALTRASARLHICSSKDGGGLPYFLKAVVQQSLAQQGIDPA